MASDVELAWAAGLFDGEASIGLGWRRPKARRAGNHGWWCLRLTLVNTHWAAIERFRSIVQVGSFYKPPLIEGRRQIYQWIATDLSAEKALRLLLPHLIIKLPQASLALEARLLGQREKFKRIPEDDFSRLIQIENEIKALNGRNPGPKIQATALNRRDMKV